MDCFYWTTVVLSVILSYLKLGCKQGIIKDHDGGGSRLSLLPRSYRGRPDPDP